MATPAHRYFSPLSTFAHSRVRDGDEPEAVPRRLTTRSGKQEFKRWKWSGRGAAGASGVFERRRPRESLLGNAPPALPRRRAQPPQPHGVSFTLGYGHAPFRRS